MTRVVFFSAPISFSFSVLERLSVQACRVRKRSISLGPSHGSGLVRLFTAVRARVFHPCTGFAAWSRRYGRGPWTTKLVLLSSGT